MKSWPRILVLTTFARDVMVYVETGVREERAGGPGTWIVEAYDRMGVPYELLTSGITIDVEMELLKGEPPPGKVITHGSRIVIERPYRAEGILINFLDDFDIAQVRQLHGEILLDGAHYTRCGPFRQEKALLALPPPELRERIAILKVNHEEYPFVPPEWIAELKERGVLLHTLGARGVELWANGNCHHFQPRSVAVKNVLGAGDTFGAAFLAHYLGSGKDALAACEGALAEVAALFEVKRRELEQCQTEARVA